MPARQLGSTAYPIDILLVSSSDHITGMTGITPTVTLSKNGGAFAAAVGTITEVGFGHYKLAGNATDLNTSGPLVVHATGAGCDPSDQTFDVVGYDPFAAIALGPAGLDAIQVETGVNARQALSPILAASAGVLVGAGTGTIVIKGGNVSLTRITASTDNAGNRTAVTLTLPS